MSALVALRKGIERSDETGSKLCDVPTRLEQSFCNMVDKIITKQRLGFCKSQVRNQETMESRDALRKAALPRQNSLDQEQFKDLLHALETSPKFRNDGEVETIVESLKVMQALDEFTLPDGILAEIAQHMVYEVYRMRNRLIMEGAEMRGMFKLCLNGIMQTDIDEFRNAMYLETGEYICEEHLRPHYRNNPEPLVMMVAKHTSHIVTIDPEHYRKYMQPCFEKAHAAKEAILREHSMFKGYSENKLNNLAGVAQICERIVENGLTQLKRHNDHHDGIFFMLMGQAAAYKKIDPIKEEKKTDTFLERLQMEAETVLCLTYVECLVLTTNDFGDTVNQETHDMVAEAAGSQPSDAFIQNTLKEYRKWDAYKKELVAEVRDYNRGRYGGGSNFGLPTFMPTFHTTNHEAYDEAYLHMAVDRTGPNNKPPPRPYRMKRTAILPPKIGQDLFSRK